MSGTTSTTIRITKTGNPLIDGVLGAEAWAGPSITYAIPTSGSAYGYAGEPQTFRAISASQKAEVRFVLTTANGNSVDDGFSVEGFTTLSIRQGAASTATIRYGASDAPKQPMPTTPAPMTVPAMSGSARIMMARSTICGARSPATMPGTR